MENPPYLRNRRTGVILPYNVHLATHPDMHPCDNLPYPKEVKKPTKPTHRRYLAAQAKKPAVKKAEKAEKQAEPPREKTAKAEPETESPGDAEINDLLAGIEHG